MLEPQGRIHEPLPGQAGDDEGHRQRIKKDGSEKRFKANPLVDHDCEQEPEGKRNGDETRAIEEQIGKGDVKALCVEKPQVLRHADEFVTRNELGVG